MDIPVRQHIEAVRKIVSQKRAQPSEAEIMAKARRKAKTRAQILVAAKSVFFRDGYAASLDAVAAAAGVARTTLFNQFDSKEQLFRIVVEDIFLRLTAGIAEVPANLPLGETLLLYGQNYIHMAMDPDAVALSKLTFAEMSRFPDFGHLAYSVGHGRTVPPLAAYLETQMRKGILISLDPHKAAERFFAAAIGHARHRVLYDIPNDDAAQAEQLLRETIEIFIKGMAPD